MLEDTDVIDTMGFRDGRYFLLIADGLVTRSLAKRKKLLTQKLATYAQAINQGVSGNKVIARKDYCIQIVCPTDPGDDYSEFHKLEVLDEIGQPLQIPIEIVVQPF